MPRRICGVVIRGVYDGGPVSPERFGAAGMAD